MENENHIKVNEIKSDYIDMESHSDKTYSKKKIWKKIP